MRVEESIFIDRPPEAVFGFLSARSNYPLWMAAVTESEWLDPAAPIGVGRRGRMVMNAMGRREFLDEVTEFEPGSSSTSSRRRRESRGKVEPASGEGRWSSGSWDRLR